MRGGANSVAYTASKWAVRGMTKTAARELARFNIRVNSIHPGLIETAMLHQVPGVDSGNMDDLDPITLIILVPWFVLAAALLVELGFRRGTQGPNRHGPDPLQ